MLALAVASVNGVEDGLSFVWLLASADQAVDCFGSFSSLLLLKFIHPVGDRVYHVARSFACSLARRFGARASLNAFGTFYYFYFFLRHKFLGEQVVL